MTFPAENVPLDEGGIQYHPILCLNLPRFNQLPSAPSLLILLFLCKPWPCLPLCAAPLGSWVSNWKPAVSAWSAFPSDPRLQVETMTSPRTDLRVKCRACRSELILVSSVLSTQWKAGSSSLGSNCARTSHSAFTVKYTSPIQWQTLRFWRLNRVTLTNEFYRVKFRWQGLSKNILRLKALFGSDFKLIYFTLFPFSVSWDKHQLIQQHQVLKSEILMLWFRCLL